MIKDPNIFSPCFQQRITGLDCALFGSLFKGDHCAWSPICRQHQDAGSSATLETGEISFLKQVGFFLKKKIN